MANGSMIGLVREYFPDVNDSEAMHILWNYTGYPSFWLGEPYASARDQLQHLKDVGFEAASAEINARMAP